MPPVPGVSVGVLLGSRTETFGLPLDCWPAPTGSTASSPVPTSRRPASRWPGFHEYLKPGRVLIFGESEIRYLESLDRLGSRRGAAPRAHATIFPA